MRIEFKCRLKNIFRCCIVRSPWLYHNIVVNLKREHRGLLVNKYTQLVITGAGGCANTFAVKAFQYAQSHPIRLAHHLHVPAQVIRAIKLAIPTLVLIREPVGAAVSLLSRGHIQFSPCAIRYIFKNYVVFYEAILPYKQGFVVGSFDSVVRNYDVVIERLNSRFGTGFIPFQNNEENIKACFAKIELGKPGTQRALDRKLIRQELLSQNYKKYIEQAQRTYINFMQIVSL